MEKKKHSVLNIQRKTCKFVLILTDLCKYSITTKFVHGGAQFKNYNLGAAIAALYSKTKFIPLIDFQFNVKKREKKSQYQTTTQRRTVRNFPKMIVLLEYLGRLASIFLKKYNHSLAY